MKVTCFLPCRKGSERVVRKNIKPFAGHNSGLLEIKLQQLCESSLINEVVLSTNDQEILLYAETLDSPKIRLHKRDELLSSSSTSTDSLVAHAVDLIQEGHILWTHVTSPFVSADDYDTIISEYAKILENGYDSLMTTTLFQGFLWNENGPFNYDRTTEKWPRTQTIAPLHDVNSAVFLSSAINYKTFNDRIGAKPYLYTLNKIKGFDIDLPDDFLIAEFIFQKLLVGK